MAQREGQGLQIAVISFAMLTIILAITTYVFYAQSQTAQKDLEAKTKNLNEKQNEVNKLKYQVATMQYVLGVKDVNLQDVDLAEKTAGGADPIAKEVLDNFNSDLAAVGDQIGADGAKSYRAINTALMAALNKKNASVADAMEQSRKLAADKDAAEQAAKARADAADAAQASAVADYDKEKQTFVAFRAQNEEEKNKLAAQITEGQKKAKESFDRVATEKDVFVKTATQQQGTIKKLMDQVKENEKEKNSLFESPDGHIIMVNQRLRMVSIDVGRTDGLLRQTTFSVFDHNENGVSNAKPKARIEVVSLGDRMSEARILDDTPANPIIKGDVIFTPAWSPGQRVHFALAMKMDINKDRIDDYDMIEEYHSDERRRDRCRIAARWNARRQHHREYAVFRGRRKADRSHRPRAAQAVHAVRRRPGCIRRRENLGR